MAYVGPDRLRLVGELAMLEDVQFVGKAAEHIQPREQSAADKIYIELGVKSPSEVIRDRGEDPVDVFDEIKADKARFEELGLSYPSAQSAAPQQAPASDESESESEEEEDEEGNLPQASGQ